MIAILDFAGVFAFALSGAALAIRHRLDIGGATVVGAIAAVGGGLIRDVLVQRTPIVFNPDSGLYVIPASLAAFIVAAGHHYVPATQPNQLSALIAIAAGLTLTIRLGSIHFGWKTIQLGR